MTIAENTKIWSQGTDTLNKMKTIILYSGSVGEVTPSIPKSCNFLFTFLFFDNVIHSLPFAILPHGGQNHENLFHHMKLCSDLEPKAQVKARPTREKGHSRLLQESPSRKNEPTFNIGDTSPHPVHG